MNFLRKKLFLLCAFNLLPTLALAQGPDPSVNSLPVAPQSGSLVHAEADAFSPGQIALAVEEALHSPNFSSTLKPADLQTLQGVQIGEIREGEVQGTPRNLLDRIVKHSKNQGVLSRLELEKDYLSSQVEFYPPNVDGAGTSAKIKSLLKLKEFRNHFEYTSDYVSRLHTLREKDRLKALQVILDQLPVLTIDEIARIVSALPEKEQSTGTALLWQKKFSNKKIFPHDAIIPDLQNLSLERRTFFKIEEFIPEKAHQLTPREALLRQIMRETADEVIQKGMGNDVYNANEMFQKFLNNDESVLSNHFKLIELRRQKFEKDIITRLVLAATHPYSLVSMVMGAAIGMWGGIGPITPTLIGEVIPTAFYLYIAQTKPDYFTDEIKTLTKEEFTQNKKFFFERLKEHGLSQVQIDELPRLTSLEFNRNLRAWAKPKFDSPQLVAKINIDAPTVIDIDAETSLLPSGPSVSTSTMKVLPEKTTPLEPQVPHEPSAPELIIKKLHNCD